MRAVLGFLLTIFLFSLRAEEIQKGETWLLLQETVKFSGVAEDDFFTLANEVDLRGDFQDDVWAAGRNIQFSGTTEEDLRLYSLEVLNVNGTVGGNLRAISSVGNLLLNTNAVVKGDAILQAGKRATVKGKAEGDLWVDASNITIEAEIMGNLSLKGNNIQLLPGTVIHGDLLNRSQLDLPLPEGVVVNGERKKLEETSTQLEKDIQRWKWMLMGIQFITAFVIGLLSLRVLPRFTGQNVDVLLHHRNPALTIGLLSFLVLSFSGYFLLASVLGTGVGIFLLLVTSVVFYLGKIMVAYALGLIILRQKTDLSFGKLTLALFIGLVVLYTAYSMVYIGDILYMMTSCWGMGSILVSIRNSQRVIKIEVPPPLNKT